MRRAKTGYLPDLQGSGWLGARGQGSFPARPAKVRACLYLQFFTGILDLIKGLESLDVSDSSDLLGANLTPFFWNAIQFSDLRAPVRPVRQRLPRFSFSRRRRLEENLPPLSPGPSFGLATVPCRGASAVGGPRPTGPELGCSTFWRRDARGFLIQRRVEACPEKCPGGPRCRERPARDRRSPNRWLPRFGIDCLKGLPTGAEWALHREILEWMHDP